MSTSLLPWAPLRHFSLLAAVSFLLLGGWAPQSADAQVSYVDRAAELGIDLVWSNDYPTGDLGAGVAMEDHDRDGDVDLFLATKTGEPLRVYLNEEGSFRDESSTLDVCVDRDIKQVLFADLDDDGWRDLVLSVWESNALGTGFLGGQVRVYQSQGGSGFVRRSDAALDSVMAGLPTGITAGDYDRDGDLDLYVSTWKPGQPDATSHNRLLRNDGGFTFEDVAMGLGVASKKKSYQSVFTDLSGDGWPDIVIAEDKRGGMTYYESLGDGTFEDRTVESGLDGYLFLGGTYVDGMGIGLGDYDHDADLDLYVTNIFDGNILYRNDGDGTYTDVASITGTSSFRVGWGCAFLDCDNDGWEDLYVVNFGMNGNSANQDRLYRNLGNSNFQDIAPAAGITLSEDGFGMATGDLDGDGRMDVLISQGEAPVRLWMCEGSVGNHFELELVGTASNRDAVGSKVSVFADGQRQFFEVRAGESYLSSHTPFLEVGLGSATAADSVRVVWPTGESETWTDLAAGQRHVLTEGASSVPVLVAPALTAAREAGGVHLQWRVDPALGWEAFELWTADAEGRTLQRRARIEAVSGRAGYEILDEADADHYALIAFAAAGSLRSTVSLSPTPDARDLQVRLPRPNPFNPRVELAFRAPAGADSRLRILDARGREVTALVAPRGSGWRTVVWDGTDAAGRAVASGRYFFEVEADRQRRVVSLSLVR